MSCSLSESEVAFIEQLTALRRVDGRRNDQTRVLSVERGAVPNLDSVLVTSPDSAVLFYAREGLPGQPLVEGEQPAARDLHLLNWLSRVLPRPGRTVFVRVLTGQLEAAALTIGINELSGLDM